MGNAQDTGGVQPRDVGDTFRTKILSWNITRFDLAKIGVAAVDDDPHGVGDNVTKIYNDIYIWWTVKQLNPDIFILIEVLTPSLNQGTLVSENAEQGVLRVLQGLRQANENWNLVPPVSLTGPSVSHHEAIAVYYRRDRLSFTGPHYWPAAGGGIQRAQPAAANSGPYPGPWNDCLRGDNLTRAAQSRYMYSSGKSEILFTQAAERRPYFTTFVEKRDEGVPRNINLVSVHLAPAQVDALYALRKIVQKLPGWDPDYDAPNTVSVIVGDFNIKVADPATVSFMTDWDNDPKTRCKAPLSDWVYGPTLATMYKWYGKAKYDDYFSVKGYDNAIVRYAKNTAVQPKRGFVADITYGDRNFVNADEAGFPSPPATFSMAWNPLISDVNNPPPLKRDDIQAIFSLPKNYGHISVESGISPNPGISDHRPIYFEI